MDIGMNETQASAAEIAEALVREAGVRARQ